MNARAPSITPAASIVATAKPILVHPAVYEQTFRFIVAPGDVAELRAIRVRGKDGIEHRVVNGYYDDAAAFARDVRKLDGRAQGVYITLNPLKRELLDRSPNKLTAGCAAATDADVLSRRWLLLDFDPKRPAGMSSTDDELASAMKRADECWLYLRSEGWPDPVSAVSGNGAHLLYRIDKPADDDGAVSRILRNLAARFSDDVVDLDTTVSNASRITKVYGSLAKKGEPTEERPHRRSVLLLASS